jgi:hypothetical protein
MLDFIGFCLIFIEFRSLLVRFDLYVLTDNSETTKYLAFWDYVLYYQKIKSLISLT